MLLEHFPQLFNKDAASFGLLNALWVFVVDHPTTVSVACVFDATAWAAIDTDDALDAVAIVQILDDLIYVRREYLVAVTSKERGVVLVFGHSPSFEAEVGHLRAGQLKETST